MKQVMAALFIVTTIMGVHGERVKAETTAVENSQTVKIQETVLGNLKKETGGNLLFSGCEIYGTKKSSAEIIVEPAEKLKKVYLHYYNFNQDKIERKPLYVGKKKEYTNKKIGGIRKQGSKTYVCRVLKNKKIQIVGYNKKNKEIMKRTFSLNEVMKKSERKNKDILLDVSNIYVTGKNKMRVLYSYQTDTGAYKGGYVDLALKKGKIKKIKKVNFKPEVIEGKYMMGVDKDNYIFAKVEIGKVIRKVSTHYGEQADIDEQLTTYEDGKIFNYARKHDFKNGKVMFTNTTGIYYASATDNTVSKVADNKDLAYYQYGTYKRYIQRIIMKSRSEFYISYGEGAFQDSSTIKECIVRYKKS